MSTAELENTSVQITIASSESTAALLSAAMYYLLTNPVCYDRLVNEIWITFPSEKSDSFSEHISDKPRWSSSSLGFSVQLS